jgi:uncharacterized protein related to proFAR isomerase
MPEHKRKNYRDAGTGEFVTEEEAEAYPETTVSETETVEDDESDAAVNAALLKLRYEAGEDVAQGRIEKMGKLEKPNTVLAEEHAEPLRIGAESVTEPSGDAAGLVPEQNDEDA